MGAVCSRRKNEWNKKQAGEVAQPNIEVWLPRGARRHAQSRKGGAITCLVRSGQAVNILEGRRKKS